MRQSADEKPRRQMAQGICQFYYAGSLSSTASLINALQLD
jgi:hypothetical protein